MTEMVKSNGPVGSATSVSNGGHAALTWKNATKTVITPGGSKANIVNNVTGSVCSGEMLAVLGLSGCGKTSLLRLITGRDDSCTGEVKFNGHAMNASYRRSIGFVYQQDMFLADLTAREHLDFAAKLRKPRNMSDADKLAAVDKVMEELAMTGFANSRISCLSGGEKKRCSIAGELLADSRILVLDEALSGLDSSVSYSLIYSLRALATAPAESDSSAKAPVGIVMTVHQPSTAIYYMFDKALFMANGCVVYYGPTASTMSYFGRLGYKLPMVPNEDGELEALPYNPADFALELIFSKIPQQDNATVHETTLAPVRAQLDKASLGLDSVKVEVKEDLNDPAVIARKKAERKEHLKFLFKRWISKVMVDSGQKLSFLAGVKKAMVEFSRWNEKYSGWLPKDIMLALYEDDRAVAEVDNAIAGAAKESTASLKEESAPAFDFDNFVLELKVLLSRTAILTSRSFALGPLKLLECIFIAVLAGLTWIQTVQEEQNVPDIAGFLFFLVSYWFFSAVFSGVLEFLPERDVVEKDYGSGAHSLLSYFSAKTVGSIPGRMLYPFLFAIIAYSVGMQDAFASGERFGALVGVIAVLMLIAICGESLGVWIGACYHDADGAVTSATIIALAMTIFGGFYLKEIPSFISWLSIVSILKYGFDAVVQLQFLGFDMECNNGFTIFACFGADEISGKDVVAFLEADTFSLTSNIVALVMLTLVCRIGGYLALSYSIVGSKNFLKFGQ
jgi:ABC-type multidrug transport system ATPase subunit